MNTLLNEEKMFEVLANIYSKTMYSEIQPMKFEDIGPTIQGIVERCTKKMFTTNGASGLDGNDVELKKNQNGNTKR